MSIRQRLTLSFLAILSLFAIDIAVVFDGIRQRTTSFQDLNHATNREFLVIDITQALDESLSVLSKLTLLLDSGEAGIRQEQAETRRTRLEAIDRLTQNLLTLADDSDRPLIQAINADWTVLSGHWETFIDRLEQPPEPDPEAAVEVEGEGGEDDQDAREADNPTGSPAGALESPGEPEVAIIDPGSDLEADEPLPQRPLTTADAHLPLADRVLEQLAELKDAERALVLQAQENFDLVAKVTNQRILVIFALSVLVALGVALSLASHLGRGLSKLSQGARRIGDGDFEHRITKPGNDELGDLAQSFNEMSANLLVARSKVEEARAAAVEANHAKSHFLANMSHELRTPLNAIIGYSEMLREDAEDLGHEALHPDLDRILAAGRHLLSLINDVLDLSKIEAGKMTLFLEEFEVAELIHEVTQPLGPLVAKNSNRLEVELSEDLGSQVADQTKVRQTLYNLLSNACKFTSDGTITLRATRSSGDTLRFQVADTGIGMSPEQTAKVFDEFTQADSSTTRKYGGTGLGLAICKRFCQLMGGDVTVDSTEGQGTTFTVELPASVREPTDTEMAAIVSTSAMRVPSVGSAIPGSGATRPTSPTVAKPSAEAEAIAAAAAAAHEGAASMPATPADPPEPSSEPSTQPRHLLLLDDDAEIRDRVCSALGRDGWTVTIAESALVALAQLSETVPEVLVLDPTLPRMDGFAFLDELADDERCQHLRAVVLTTPEVDRERLTALGPRLLAEVSKTGRSPESLVGELRQRLATL